MNQTSSFQLGLSVFHNVQCTRSKRIVPTDLAIPTAKATAGTTETTNTSSMKVLASPTRTRAAYVITNANASRIIHSFAAMPQPLPLTIENDR